MKYLLILISFNCFADCYDDYDNTEDRLTCIRAKRAQLQEEYEAYDRNLTANFHANNIRNTINNIVTGYQEIYKKDSEDTQRMIDRSQQEGSLMRLQFYGNK